MSTALPLAFVLLDREEEPNPEAIVACAEDLGLELVHEPGDSSTHSFALAAGGTLMVALMPAPHPDAIDMPAGPTSPQPTVVEQHVAHYVVTAIGLPDGELSNESIMCIATSAVIRSSPAVAAMLGNGVVFHDAEYFAAEVESEPAAPVGVTVDVTVAPDGEDRVSFLTHGLRKDGRDEFYVTASVTGTGAMGFLQAITRWMVLDPEKVLPTGDTIGRSAEEKVKVQRVPSPIDGDPDVVRLDLDVPDPASTTTKRGLFRKRR